MSFWSAIGGLIGKLASASAQSKGAPAPPPQPFPSDPVVTKWMTLYVDVEKVAKFAGIVLPAAAMIANDMEELQPFIPYLIKLAEAGTPVQPGDPAYNLPSGNPDAMRGGSDNANV